MPISLSDDELRLVMDLARPLSPGDRVAFARDVMSELEQHPEFLGSGAIHRLARGIQKRYFDPPDLRGSMGNYD